MEGQGPVTLCTLCPSSPHLDLAYFLSQQPLPLQKALRQQGWFGGPNPGLPRVSCQTYMGRQ